MPLEDFERDTLARQDIPALLPVTSNVYMQKEYRSMLYVQRLTLPNRRNGRVFFYIDEEALLKRMQMHFDPGVSYTGICLQDGTVLLSTDDDISRLIFDALPAAFSSGSIHVPDAGLVSYHHSDVLPPSPISRAISVALIV